MLYQAGGSMRNKMLDTNPWLNSRFSHFIEFGDWGLEDCLHLFHKRAATGNFTLQEAAELELKDGFSTLLPLDGCGSRCGQSLESFPPRLGPCFTGFQDGSHFCSVDSGAGSCSWDRKDQSLVEGRPESIRLCAQQIK